MKSAYKGIPYNIETVPQGGIVQILCYILHSTKVRVLQKHWQPAIFCLLHFTVSATYCNHTCIIQMVCGQH